MTSITEYKDKLLSLSNDDFINTYHATKDRHINWVVEDVRQLRGGLGKLNLNEIKEKMTHKLKNKIISEYGTTYLSSCDMVELRQALSHINYINEQENS
jgi:hypothetical protein